MPDHDSDIVELVARAVPDEISALHFEELTGRARRRRRRRTAVLGAAPLILAGVVWATRSSMTPATVKLAPAASAPEVVATSPDGLDRTEAAPDAMVDGEDGAARDDVAVTMDDLTDEEASALERMLEDARAIVQFGMRDYGRIAQLDEVRPSDRPHVEHCFAEVERRWRTCDWLGVYDLLDEVVDSEWKEQMDEDDPNWRDGVDTSRPCQGGLSPDRDARAGDES